MDINSFLNENEVYEDLMCNGLGIIQKKDGFRFGMDAVLLSGFARIERDENVVDLCSGSGILPLLLSAKTNGGHFTGIELVPETADRARRSVAANNLSEKITILEQDVRNAADILGKNCFDVVTCNPPYIKEGAGAKSPMDERAIARHEICLTLEQVIDQASKLLKPNGRLYVVHRPFRLTELIVHMDRAKIPMKRLRMVHAYKDREPTLVLAEGIKGAKPYLNVDSPLIVYNDQGEYTPELRKCYGLDHPEEFY